MGLSGPRRVFFIHATKIYFTVDDMNDDSTYNEFIRIPM